jgi:hypothetical protein
MATKHSTFQSLSLSFAFAMLLTALAHVFLPGAKPSSAFMTSSTFGLFILFFAACSVMVRMAFWYAETRRTNRRVVATFKLRSHELAAVRQMLSQGKSNEALTYMQGLSGTTKQ